jgi:hypothetical protein
MSAVPLPYGHLLRHPPLRPHHHHHHHPSSSSSSSRTNRPPLQVPPEPLFRPPTANTHPSKLRPGGSSRGRTAPVHLHLLVGGRVQRVAVASCRSVAFGPADGCIVQGARCWQCNMLHTSYPSRMFGGHLVPCRLVGAGWAGGCIVRSTMQGAGCWQCVRMVLRGSVGGLPLFDGSSMQGCGSIVALGCRYRAVGGFWLGKGSFALCKLLAVLLCNSLEAFAALDSKWMWQRSAGVCW